MLACRLDVLVHKVVVFLAADPAVLVTEIQVVVLQIRVLSNPLSALELQDSGRMSYVCTTIQYNGERSVRVDSGAEGVDGQLRYRDEDSANSLVPDAKDL